MRKLGMVLMCLAAMGPAPAAISAETNGTIVFFDPDANYEAMPRLVKGMNDYFGNHLPGYKLQAVSDVTGMLAAIKAGHAEYAIIGSQYVDEAKQIGITPLLVSESKGSNFYRKILLDRGTGSAGNLRGKRVAAAVGGRTSGAGARVLGELKSAGLSVDNAIFLGTSKDLDALFALAFGEADAALVTAGSLETLRAVNPRAAESMRTIWTSPDIMRPVLVAVQPFETPHGRDGVLAAFAQLTQADYAMRALGIDKWMPYSGESAKRVTP